MKGGFGCSPCCGPTCEQCTRTCTEPHTGSAFEVVYTRFFEGAEAGNPTDGYLTATGDSDTSDPYDGMDGSGPWFQQVGGGFNDGGSSGGGTRFPCTYRFSFWRSNYTLGASTIPPASTALTKNVITVNVSYGAVVFPDGRVITSADGPVELASTIPLVSGGASAADPRTGEGSVSFALQCQNVETQFSVQARIEWNTQKRQHILYGIVRECYDTPDPENPDVTSCDTFCDGDPAPSEMYLTLSGISTASEVFPSSGGSSSPSMSFLNDTYVVSEYQKNYGVCDVFLSGYTGMFLLSAINIGFTIGNQWPYATPDGDTWVTAFFQSGGSSFRVVVVCKKGRADVCSSTSGTGSVHVQEIPITATSRYFLGTCSWTLSP